MDILVTDQYKLYNTLKRVAEYHIVSKHQKIGFLETSDNAFHYQADDNSLNLIYTPKYIFKS